MNFIPLYPQDYYRVTIIIKMFYYQVLPYIKCLALRENLQRKVIMKHILSSFKEKQ